MSVKGILYLDKKGREVLYVPKVFIVINYARKDPDVILEPGRLKIWFRNWGEGKVSLERVIDYPEIDGEDIELITECCFKNEIDEAKWWCVGVFDQSINKVYDMY